MQRWPSASPTPRPHALPSTPIPHRPFYRPSTAPLQVIKTALLKMPTKELEAQAIQCFRNITGFMGDRNTNKEDVGHAEKLLKTCLPLSQELRDEVYCQVRARARGASDARGRRWGGGGGGGSADPSQRPAAHARCSPRCPPRLPSVRCAAAATRALLQIIKQTTNNPSPESTLKGWMLMGVVAGAFAPSKEFEPYLLSHSDAHREDGGGIGPYALYAMGRILKTGALGPRREVPTSMEIDACKARLPVLVRVYHLDGKWFTAATAAAAAAGCPGVAGERARGRAAPCAISPSSPAPLPRFLHCSPSLARRRHVRHDARHVVGHALRAQGDGVRQARHRQRRRVCHLRDDARGCVWGRGGGAELRRCGGAPRGGCARAYLSLFAPAPLPHPPPPPQARSGTWSPTSAFWTWWRTGSACLRRRSRRARTAPPRRRRRRPPATTSTASCSRCTSTTSPRRATSRRVSVCAGARAEAGSEAAWR
jgi:hypothetical protein